MYAKIGVIYFPTDQSMIAELLRKNPNYDINREAKDKIHITGQVYYWRMPID